MIKNIKNGYINIKKLIFVLEAREQQISSAKSQIENILEFSLTHAVSYSLLPHSSLKVLSSTKDTVMKKWSLRKDIGKICDLNGIVIQNI